MMLSESGFRAIRAYIAGVRDGCMSEDDTWPLADAYDRAGNDHARSCIAAAIVYDAEAYSDPPTRPISGGEFADKNLVLIAKQLDL